MSSSVISPVEALRAFQPAVDLYRSVYIESIRLLPPSLFKIAEDHLKARISRAAPKPLLGEFVPILISDILGLKNSDHLQHTVSGWLHIYYAVMMLDDAIDCKDQGYDGKEVITAAFLFERGLNRLLGLVESDRQEFLDEVVATTVEAAVHELQSRRYSTKDFSADDFKTVTNKLALLKLCVESIVATGPALEHRRVWLHELMEQLATGFQLLDDIADWEEDFQAKNMTLPLAGAFNERTVPVGTKFDGDTTLNANTLIITLVYTGSFQETIKIAMSALASCIESVSKSTSVITSTEVFLKSLLHAAGNSLLQLDDIKMKLHAIVTAQICVPDANHLRDALTEQDIRDFSSDIRGSLEVIAQGS